MPKSIKPESEYSVQVKGSHLVYSLLELANVLTELSDRKSELSRQMSEMERQYMSLRNDIKEMDLRIEAVIALSDAIHGAEENG